MQSNHTPNASLSVIGRARIIATRIVLLALVSLFVYRIAFYMPQPGRAVASPATPVQPTGLDSLNRL